MKINYTKNCTLPSDLIPLLKSRGLIISDEQKAVNYLTNISYFRFSAYLYPLLKHPKTDHIYKDNSTFEMALDMYRFDRKLRILLFNEIEKIEIAIRTAMNNLVSDAFNDVFWMTQNRYFYNQAIFAKTLQLTKSEIDKTKEEFIIHFQNKYTDTFPPAWMISEIIPLGLICGIFNNLQSAAIKKKVANQFKLPLSVFSSWILTLVNLRNVCCHHGRTWNRESHVVPIEPNSLVFSWVDTSKTDPKRIYYRICIIKYLLFTVSSKNNFTQKLKELLAKYPTIDIRAMGFPADWQNEPLWKI